MPHYIIFILRVQLQDDPAVGCLPLCPDNASQDAKFGVVFLAKGARPASMRKSLDCLGLLHHSIPQEEFQFRLIIQLT